ncbi:MAG: PilZ domain-containing protein [Archangiaceae bacterium]|nr:PilZ domain-containing protein [Archangiaceae bacterium]
MTLTAHCRIGTRFIRDAIADLSQGGLYLKTREPAREGTPVRVALALPHDDGPKFCTLVGCVARVDRDPRGRALGLGVSFDEAQTGLYDRTTLSAFIARVQPTLARV